VESSDLEEWIAINRKLIAGEEWIIDGNYLKTLDLRIKESDAIIYLKINIWLCFYRVIKRTLWNLGKKRADLPDGCIEKINFSFFISTLFFNEKIRPLIFRRIEENQGYSKLIIHSSDAKNFCHKYLR
jgi:adenylate kinase family enzyme